MDRVAAHLGAAAQVEGPPPRDRIEPGGGVAWRAVAAPGLHRPQAREPERLLRQIEVAEADGERRADAVARLAHGVGQDRFRVHGD
jgi:hypothetical protein